MDSDAVGLQLLAVAKTQLGYSETGGGYTKFGAWYAQHLEGGDSYFSTAPWCDMFLAWAADQAGVSASAGEFAATVDHAKWFSTEGAFGHQPEIGAIVFFSWNGGKSLDDIEHVGLVESVSGHTLHTIEANTGGSLARKTRSMDQVVGYGYPAKVKVQTVTAPYVAKHASPPLTADAFLRETAGTTGQAQASITSAVRTAPAVSAGGGGGGGTTLPIEVAALSGLVGLLLCGSLALAVGRVTAQKVPTPSVPEVRMRKRGKHHRKSAPVTLPADITPAEMDEAESSTVMMPAVTAAAAQLAEDKVFWGKISEIKDDEELSFWSDLHDTVATSNVAGRTPARSAPPSWPLQLDAADDPLDTRDWFAARAAR